MVAVVISGDCDCLMIRYENVTSEGGDNVTVELVTVLEEVLEVLEETEVVAMESTPETIVGGDEGEGVDYVIPDNMRVTMEPKEEVSLYITRYCLELYKRL